MTAGRRIATADRENRGPGFVAGVGLAVGRAEDRPVARTAGVGLLRFAIIAAFF